MFVRVSRHLWFFSCFLLQSLQGRQCLLEIRSMPQWHCIRTLLIGMKPPFALIVEVFLCGQMMSVIFIRKSIPSSTTFFISMMFKQGSNTMPLRHRSNFKQALSTMQRLQQEAGEEPQVPTYSYKHQQWEARSSSSTWWNWQGSWWTPYHSESQDGDAPSIE